MLFQVNCCTDGMDGRGLKLEKFWPTFEVLMPCLQKSSKKLLWLVPPDETCLIYIFITLN